MAAAVTLPPVDASHGSLSMFHIMVSGRLRTRSKCMSPVTMGSGYWRWHGGSSHPPASRCEPRVALDVPHHGLGAAQDALEVHVSCDHGFRLLAVAWRQQSPSRQ